MQTKASNASAPLASLDLTSFHISAPGLCRHICQYIILQNLTFVRPWWHNLSHFSHGLNTCFIHGSNRQGMDGTLGVAPRHAYDTKFASWLVSQQFAATTLRRLRGGPWKRRAVSCEKTQAPGKRAVLCVYIYICMYVCMYVYILYHNNSRYIRGYRLPVVRRKTKNERCCQSSCWEICLPPSAS